MYYELFPGNESLVSLSQMNQFKNIKKTKMNAVNFDILDLQKWQLFYHMI